MSVVLQKSNIFNGPEVTIENICTEMALLADNNICVSIQNHKEMGYKCVIYVYLMIFDTRVNIYCNE